MKTTGCHRWIIAGLVIPVLFLSGCYSRKEASLVTNRLGTASDEAGKLVTQMQASDAANVAALKELHAAFLTGQKEKALAGVAAKEAGFLQAIERQQSDLLREFGTERARFITAFKDQVTELIKPLVEREEDLGKKANAAHQAREPYPHDKDLQLAEAETAAAYLAVGTARIQLVAGASLKAYADSQQAVDALSAEIATLAEEARGKVHAAAETARTKINAQSAPADRLPPAGTAGYAALAAYVKAVRTSSDSFAHYLESNSLATKSFFGSFVSGFGENIVEGVKGAFRGDIPKPADVIKEGTDLANSFYQEVLNDNDTNGKAIVSQLGKDAKKAGQDLTKLGVDQAKAYITGKLPDILKSFAPTKDQAPAKP